MRGVFPHSSALLNGMRLVRRTQHSMDWLLDTGRVFVSTGTHNSEHCYWVGCRVSAEHTCYYVQLLGSYKLDLSSDVVVYVVKAFRTRHGLC
jgi:hypothetical protein